MKIPFLTLLSSAAAMTMASAFTIDFNNLTVSDGVNTSAFTIGTVDAGNPQTVNVPGYGDVLFQVGPLTADSLTVGSTHSNDGGSTFQQSLEIDSNEVVVVTFLGPAALNVDFDIIGVSSGENGSVAQTGAAEYQYAPGGGPGTADDGAGIAAISWNTVPEPSSTLLITLGAGSLLLRRRR